MTNHPLLRCRLVHPCCEMSFLCQIIYINFQEVLNFTYHLSKSPDGQWGATQPDGSWSGMVKELQEQRADMGKFLSFLRFHKSALKENQALIIVLKL